MTLWEWNSLNRSFVEHPPVDLLVASYLGYKAPAKSSGNSLRDRARTNAQALQTTIHPAIGTLGDLFNRKGTKTLDQMPEWVRGPEKMALIAQMKADMIGEANG
jgi:hypothetical protein